MYTHPDFSSISEHAPQILCDVVNGIIEVHRSGRFHGDVKSQNILMKNFGSKLCDFECSRMEKTFKRDEVLKIGYGFAAPEYFTKDHAVTHKFDIYSFGVLFIEMMSYLRIDQKYFWKQYTLIENREEESKKGEKGAFHQLFLTTCDRLKDRAPSAITNLIYRCLQLNPANRPSAQQLLRDIQEIRARGFFSVVPKAQTKEVQAHPSPAMKF